MQEVEITNRMQRLIDHVKSISKNEDQRIKLSFELSFILGSTLKSAIIILRENPHELDSLKLKNEEKKIRKCFEILLKRTFRGKTLGSSNYVISNKVCEMVLDAINFKYFKPISRSD